MQLKRYINHKTKPKLITFLMLLLLLLSLIIPIMVYQPLTVQAVTGNGTGDDGSINGKGNCGAQTSTTAFMMYVVH